MSSYQYRDSHDKDNKVSLPSQLYHMSVYTWKGDLSWWRNQMETFSALLAICAGNSPVTGEFPTQRPMTRSFDVFFDLRPNKQLRKQWWGWWFGTQSCPLWRHSNVYWYRALTVVCLHSSKNYARGVWFTVHFRGFVCCALLGLGLLFFVVAWFVVLCCGFAVLCCGFVCFALLWLCLLCFNVA